jgi:uncharacterized protein YbjT (DUF2867 family)
MKLVTGATGNVGRELVDALVARGAGVRAVVRDPARAGMPDGAEPVTADLESPESLTTALGGIDGVFLLGGWNDMPEILRRVRQAGVERVVLLSSRCVIGGRADNPITRMWLDSEAAVRDSGAAWTVLRPSGFQSNALRWLPQLRGADVVRAPWPDVPIAAIDPGRHRCSRRNGPHRHRTRRHGVHAERTRSPDARRAGRFARERPRPAASIRATLRRAGA